MCRLTPRCSRFRDLANLAGIVACAICITVNGAARENEESPARPPYHPYLAPALSLAEMASGDEHLPDTEQRQTPEYTTR